MGTNTNTTPDMLTGSAPGPRFVDGFRPVSSKTGGKPAAQRTDAHHMTAHKPAPSKTLMRTAVKKPAIQSAATIKAKTRTDILARTPKQTVAPKVSYGSVNPARLKKASQMIKNPTVSHYGSVTDVTATPISYAAKTNPSLAASLDSLRTATSSSAVPVLPVSEMRTPARRPDMFEQALARATSHEQTFDDRQIKSRGRRIGLLVSACMSLLVLAGAVAYFNVPQLSMRLASARAGFQAKLPAYSPAGYSFGNISYGPGNVTISYKLDDSHKFDITQRATQWDSQALLSNFVGSANKAYQTYERAGRTVYFFGNNTATWVDNGVWYTVNGNNSLTKNQLLDLAGSI